MGGGGGGGNEKVPFLHSWKQKYGKGGKMKWAHNEIFLYSERRKKTSKSVKCWWLMSWYSFVLEMKNFLIYLNSRFAIKKGFMILIYAFNIHDFISAFILNSFFLISFSQYLPMSSHFSSINNWTRAMHLPLIFLFQCAHKNFSLKTFKSSQIFFFSLFERMKKLSCHACWKG
jgi:hypothetical protein